MTPTSHHNSPWKRVASSVLAAVLLGGMTVGTATAAEDKTPATGGDRAPESFVALSDVDPTILHEIRYVGHHNFVGRPITGYEEPLCLLTEDAAHAVRDAQQAALSHGYTLKVYDCFRPQRSVDDFVRWAQQPGNDRMRDEFYPRIDKDRLFPEGYIAEQSGHSRGSTIDLTLVELPAQPQRPYKPGEPLVECYAPQDQRFPDNSVDMGTGFDCFDETAATEYPGVPDEVRENRFLLRDIMADAGFGDYPVEWWHFTLEDEPYPDEYFDFPISRESLE
ncbi:D-alanyl-D-alanine dipeptidase [Saccharomonospora sp. CUA-673]|uniref:M15 family metallopeptidase n=1 Tax=Saccharomonospora sp. CUA-673 TaxID=1904969 RepID=UPI000962909C|nr:M15 family metallopeptidase [Saccharomonospora sp. CUA-673]OLT42644.1 D-alanyl-D-alanine dipeptidase [Saccharomonospora sp. CUA-673]